MANIDIIASFVSTLCCIALLKTWFLLQKWRSLHNFISLHQIFAGTLHLYSITMYDLAHCDALIHLNGYLFMIAASWSFCASLFAYLKLRLVYMQRISYEKRKAFVLAYGVAAIFKIITNGIVPNLYQPKTMYSKIVPSMLCFYLMETVNMILFISITKSVVQSCNRSLREKGKRVIALIGVAIMCDIITIIYMMSLLPKLLFLEYETDVLKTMFALRLIPQSIVLLLNRRTRQHWREYLTRRRNQRSNFLG